MCEICSKVSGLLSDVSIPEWQEFLARHYDHNGQAMACDGRWTCKVDWRMAQVIKKRLVRITHKHQRSRSECTLS